ncbi:MAG: phosphoribosylglycinamide formyltransferase [Rhodospirillales bacterium]|nr:phosphoribosylglycinamide formyltransferase [Rhodospirillales bacterium]
MKIAVLISGRGTNLQSLIDAAAAEELGAEIALVVSNVPDAPGLERAAKAGIPTETIDHRDFEGREPFEEALHSALSGRSIELVCLAGFMRLLTGGFVGKWRDRLINIHPSILPAFKGLHTHERAIEAGVRFSGCTVHFVTPEMDDGPIIAQAAVPVLQGDTPGDLAARILAEEHKLYPLAVRLIAEGRAKVAGNKVEISGTAEAPSPVVNPAG